MSIPDPSSLTVPNHLTAIQAQVSGSSARVEEVQVLLDETSDVARIEAKDCRQHQT